MSYVASLFGFGIGFLGFGFYWKLMDDIYNTHIMDYVIPGRFYDASDLIWELLPWICILIGVACLVSAGIAHQNSGGQQK